MGTLPGLDDAGTGRRPQEQHGNVDQRLRQGAQFDRRGARPGASPATSTCRTRRAGKISRNMTSPPGYIQVVVIYPYEAQTDDQLARPWRTWPDDPQADAGCQTTLLHAPQPRPQERTAEGGAHRRGVGHAVPAMAAAGQRRVRGDRPGHRHLLVRHAGAGPCSARPARPPGERACETRNALWGPNRRVWYLAYTPVRT